MFSITLIELVLNHLFDAVAHGAQVAYVYGRVPPTADAASRDLSVVMMDYWISFVVSLDPNDRKGAEREYHPSLSYWFTIQSLGMICRSQMASVQVCKPGELRQKSSPLNVPFNAILHIGIVAAGRRQHHGYSG